jgi:hypothetical protein
MCGQKLAEETKNVLAGKERERIKVKLVLLKKI